jgi:DNA-binding transcriptional LysR family regulator
MLLRICGVPIIRSLPFSISVQRQPIRGSFRRGADSLLVRQSTLSRRCIRQLEYSIGLKIFERSSDVRATKAGFNFLRISRSILEQVASLVESTRRAGENKARQLAIGFGSSLSTGNLRETIIDHTCRFPQIETV